ncbi:MAG: double-stranded uracil-DNA glycosylase [Chloroflexota bacterium]|jgi:TDG/mug DNA glycosylase family protein|nr:double-stranded uracil-DNA glycosylase [Chloroflexota bacterium]
MKRPLPAEVATARERTVPDVIAPGLRILFVGINPGIWSGATGFHFAKPGNRFWKAIHLAGLTPTLLSPDQSHELLRNGIGITNLVNRTTAVASELSIAELQAGARALADKVERNTPEKVAFLGLSAYRLAFGKPKAIVGRQDVSVGGCATWVLPNPSGLNAHYQLADLAKAYAALK